MPITSLGVIGMFDVYVRGKSQLIVVRRGAPLPTDLVSGWRKKRAARNVSEEISRTVKREGFYKRSMVLQIDIPAEILTSYHLRSERFARIAIPARLELSADPSYT